MTLEKIIIILLFSISTLFNATIVYSQIDKDLDTVAILKKNTIYVELGGNAILYSINYDRLFNISNKFKLSSRLGIHYTNKVPLQYYRTFCIPVEVSGLYSFFGRKHFIEIGTGLSYFNSYDRITNHTEDILIVALRLGYRFQNPEGGFFFKLGFVPLYDWLVINPDPAVPHHTWLFSGGLGLGYTF